MPRRASWLERWLTMWPRYKGRNRTKSSKIPMRSSQTCRPCPPLTEPTSLESSIVLLVAFAFFAVFTWAIVQVRTAISGRAVAEPPRRRVVKLLRTSLAAIALVVTAGAAYLEWKAREQATRAFRAVIAQRAGNGRNVITRKDIEALIGRTADESFPGSLPGDRSVTYRWRGIFRSHQLHALYRPKNARSTPSEEDTGSDILVDVGD